MERRIREGYEGGQMERGGQREVGGGSEGK